MPLRPAAAAAFLPYTAPLEGVVDHLYLDVKGLVTIGVGCLVDPVDLALALPMRWRKTGDHATREEIRAEWLAIKTNRELARLGAGAARKHCRLYLAPEDVDALTTARLERTVRALERRFPAFDAYPASAQLALVSLAWACGVAFAYPKLDAAVRRGDWTTAAAECGIKGNLPRSAAQKRLFEHAAASDDPDSMPAGL